MLPLMLAATMFICVFSLVTFEASDLAAYRHTLQFDADQIALVAAGTQQKDFATVVRAAGLAELQKFDSENISIEAGQADVKLCSTWVAHFKLVFAPTAQQVCVVASSR